MVNVVGFFWGGGPVSKQLSTFFDHYGNCTKWQKEENGKHFKKSKMEGWVGYKLSKVLVVETRKMDHLLLFFFKIFIDWFWWSLRDFI